MYTKLCPPITPKRTNIFFELSYLFTKLCKYWREKKGSVTVYLRKNYSLNLNCQYTKTIDIHIIELLENKEKLYKFFPLPGWLTDKLLRSIPSIVKYKAKMVHQTRDSF